MVEIYLPPGRNPGMRDEIPTYVSVYNSSSQPINVEEELKGQGEDLEVPLPQTCDVKEALIVKL